MSFKKAVLDRVGLKTGKVEVYENGYLIDSCGEGTCDMWDERTCIVVKGRTVWWHQTGDGLIPALERWLDGGDPPEYVFGDEHEEDY